MYETLCLQQNHSVLLPDGLYRRGVPKLWEDSVEAHRSAVRDAVLDAAGALLAEHGRPTVTMSRIAQDAGVGRATLYKYFADAGDVLTAWHQRQVQRHLQLLGQAAARPGAPLERLRAVLAAYAGATRRQHSSEVATLLHAGEHVAGAQEHVRQLLAGLIVEAVDAGQVRRDVAPAELAAFCLHALTAAAAVRTDAAVRRLIEVTVDGLRPQA